MSPTALRAKLAQANRMAVRTQIALRQAIETATASADRAALLADRPDLLRGNILIADLANRRMRLEAASAEYMREYEAGVEFLRQTVAFVAPKRLARSATYARELHARLCKPSCELDNVFRQSWLDSLKQTAAALWRCCTLAGPRCARPSLEARIWARISERRKSLSEARHHANCVADPGTMRWDRFYRTALLSSDYKWHSFLGWLQNEADEYEQQVRDLRQQHDEQLSKSVRAELEPARLRIDGLARAVAEAEQALASLPAIEAHVGIRSKAFIAERTCARRADHKRAVATLRSVRKLVAAHFQLALGQDFLAVRAEDYAPHLHTMFVGRLRAFRRAFVRRWVDSELGMLPDHEQADAIATVHDNALVAARAGGGKTRTLVARAAFLVKHCRVIPNELLLLTFNKAAAIEMQDRLAAIGCLLPHVMTFHALAYAVVHPSEAILYDDPDGQRPALSRAVQQVIDDLLRRENCSQTVRRALLSHFRDDWTELVDEAADVPQDEGLDYRRSLRHESLKGDYVRSYGEKAISNFLFEHGIEYRYEKSHNWNGRNYRPDFTIEVGRAKAVIEYFGLAGDPDYDDEADRKRQFWQGKPNWTFIELLPRQIANGEFQNVLRDRLGQLGFSCDRLSEDEIWSRVWKRTVTSFATMMGNFLGRCRKADLSPEDLARRIVEHTSATEAEASYLNFAAAAYAAYLERIAAAGEEDFDGLLQRACVAVEGGVTAFDRKSGPGDLARVRSIMVDEFQDFSPLFFRLIRAIQRHSPSAQLYCVGDDWQAINGFAGSDVRYFRRFADDFTPAVRRPIPTNYRSAARVVDAGNRLMSGRGMPALAGRELAGRVLVADLSLFRPTAEEWDAFGSVVITPAVRRLLYAALVESDDADVLLLSRTHTLPRPVEKEKPAAKLGEALRVWTRSLTAPQLRRVKLLTAHQSKGLEARTVVVLDALERRYPFVHPSWIFGRLFGDTVGELIEDERRLFYVACTRATETLILITENGNRSPFLDAFAGISEPINWDEFPMPP